MPRSDREDKAPEARALYAAGAAKSHIAKSLGVARSTVTRWSQEDGAAGRPWKHDADPMQRGRLRALLERRLADLAKQGADGKEAAAAEDRMLKICRVLDHLQDEGSQLDALVDATLRFAKFCRRNLSEDEMGPVRKAVRLFVEHLKKELS